jgi:hypothetical protein
VQSVYTLEQLFSLQTFALSKDEAGTIRFRFGACLAGVDNSM